MTRSPGMRAAFILRRMRYSRLLLACILAAIIIITALVTALANFAARALPAAAGQQLTSAAGPTIAINSTSASARPGPADRLILSSARTALGSDGFGIERAVWSDPLSLPDPSNGRSIWSAEVASMSGITTHARLTSGSWPAPSRPGQPVGVAIPAADAAPLGMSVGQTLRLVDGDNQHLAILRITGLYEATSPAGSYWGLDLISPSGSTVQPGFRTFGPFIAQPGALTSGQLTASEVSWLVTPALAPIQPGQMTGIAGRLQHAIGQMTQANMTVSTSLPQLMAGIATSYDVSRSLLITSALELLVVAAAALALTARLLASQRADEGALLAARGLTRRQLSLLALTEALLLVVVAAVAGAVLGNLVAGPLESAGVLRAERQHLAAAGSAAWWPGAVVAGLALLILGWPAIMPGAAASVSASRGRQPAIALITRAGADVAVIALAVLTGWQLHRYSVIARSTAGSIGIDPVLVAAPPLILVGAALIPLRLVPALARLGDKLSARGRRLVAALATWEISRRPVRQAGPALLAILAVGTGTLALAQQQSWNASVRDQSAAQVGADVRVNLAPDASLASPAAVLGSHVVTAAMPVSAFDGGLGAPVMALDARVAARTVLLRPDQASVPLPALWRKITPSGAKPGLAIPGDPSRLAITTRMSAAPASWDLGPLPVTLSIQAADGVGYAVPAGSLQASGRNQILTAGIPAAARVSAPIRLLGLTVAYQMPGFTTGPNVTASIKALPRQRVTLTVSNLAAAGPTGPFPAPFAAGAALDSWNRGATSSTLAASQYASGREPALVSWRPAAGAGRTLTFSPGYGHLIPKAGLPPLPISAELTMAVPADPAPLPAIATTSFLGTASTKVGGLADVAVGNYRVPVTIVAAVKSFPTAGQGGALIVDQGALQAELAGRSGPPLPVTSWWLSTAGEQIPAGLPAGEVTSLRQVTAQMQANLLSAAPERAVLGLILAVALLALLGFSVSVAASISERRARSALLSALGVTRIAQARQLCLEQVLLALPAAVIGLLAGTLIAHLLVPAVTITDRATLPVPSALVYIPAGWALTLAAVVAATPVLVAAVTIVRKPDPAAELRAAGTT
jgi:predicted lysophospholipase L1 biosynthesis ABC-type transport system permease subunit